MAENKAVPLKFVRAASGPIPLRIGPDLKEPKIKMKNTFIRSMSCILALFQGQWMISDCHAAEAVKTGMTLEVGTPWVVEDGQPEAVRRALKDVEKDWYKIFCRNPVILKEVPAAGWRTCWRRSSTNPSPSDPRSGTIIIITAYINIRKGSQRTFR